VIPRLLEGRDAGDVIRIWSVGCSTGEEAYSLAILLQERLGAIRQNCTVQVFATDIDPKAIATARAGLYPASIAADLSPERLARFFSAEAGGSMYRVHKGIRDMLVFSEQDLAKDPPFSRLDLICCRNLLIYMGSVLHKKVIPLFHYALNPGGFLFIGKSETVGEFTDLFAAVDRSSKIYQRSEELSAVNRKALGQFVQTVTARAGSRAQSPEKARIIGKQDLRALMEQALLQQLAPAGALVNGQGDILYLHGRTGLFLEPPQGEPGVSNILAMAREGLRPDLTIALRKAAATNDVVHCPSLRIRTNGDFSRANLTVRPVDASSAADPKALLYLVLLEIVALHDEGLEAGAPHPVEAADGAEDAAEGDARILELRKKLRAKEDYLQATNEELATSNEELKSSNEEMQSVNEELQSANEELQTSREELQSINEELATVNAELQTKVADLSQVNNDMNNLLAGTGIGTVFVDLQLLIVRFTPAATRIINLIAADIGRPVGNITANLRGYDTLVDDVHGVLDTLIPKELEAQTKSGTWYAMRIQPYRTLDNVIEGAVITFVDISERKTAQDALRLIEERYRNLMNYSSDAVFIEHQGAVALVNPACLLLFKARSESELIGKSAYDLVHPDFRERLKAHISGLLNSSDPASPIMVKILRLDGVSVDIELLAAPFAFAGMKDIHFILRESHADSGN
jgi:two-component system CheB/CheR fusion protein